jgi:methyltransferase (TIGR00027 family)
MGRAEAGPVTAVTGRLVPVAQTALWTAAARARESARQDRLFDDPLATVLAGTAGADLLAHFDTAHSAPDGNPFLPIRTRWFDDFLTGGARAGQQVVGLGAGLDTRAFRLNWPDGTTLFEVDRPDLLAYKDDRLAACGVPASAGRCDRRAVPADLGTDWVGALNSAGFDAAAPTLWFGEGLVFYLAVVLAESVLRAAARASALGSAIAIDLVGTGIFRLPYTRPFLRRLEAAGSPWRFGTDDPAGFVRECGWPTVTVTEPGRPDADFGRWPANANPTNLPGLPRSYLVTARRDG